MWLWSFLPIAVSAMAGWLMYWVGGESWLWALVGYLVSDVLWFFAIGWAER